MYKIDGIVDFNIFSTVTFMIIPMLNPYNILYSLAAKTLCVIHLYFIDDQYMIFTLLITLIRQII